MHIHYTLVRQALHVVVVVVYFVVEEILLRVRRAGKILVVGGREAVGVVGFGLGVDHEGVFIVGGGSDGDGRGGDADLRERGAGFGDWGEGDAFDGAEREGGGGVAVVVGVLAGDRDVGEGLAGGNYNGRISN